MVTVAFAIFYAILFIVKPTFSLILCTYLFLSHKCSTIYFYSQKATEWHNLQHHHANTHTHMHKSGFVQFSIHKTMIQNEARISLFSIFYIYAVPCVVHCAAISKKSNQQFRWMFTLAFAYYLFIYYFECVLWHIMFMVSPYASEAAACLFTLFRLLSSSSPSHSLYAYMFVCVRWNACNCKVCMRWCATISLVISNNLICFPFLLR